MIARAPVHVAYMESIMPPEGAALRKQMNALKALDEGRATEADRKYIKGNNSGVATDLRIRRRVWKGNRVRQGVSHILSLLYGQQVPPMLIRS